MELMFLKDQRWRYATKRFDTTKKVSVGKLNILKEAIQLAPSSYGLQAFKVLIIEDSNLRQRLLPYSWGQRQITECSHLFVFCYYTAGYMHEVDKYIEHTARERKQALEDLKGYGDFIKTQLFEMGSGELNAWASRQTYIAMNNLLAACASLRIDSCPMEGFDPNGYDEVLGLSDQHLCAAIIAPVGYRDSEDKSQYLRKVRKPFEDLFKQL